jgi:heterodisulfide reductase subunit C
MRGPLRFILLADTGQDVNQCSGCGCCYVGDEMQAEFDLELWEVLAAARQDDEAALTNQTIWALAEAQLGEIRCTNGVDFVAIARSLRREAELRGLTRPESEETD